VRILVYSGDTILRDGGECGWYVDLFELCDLRCVLHSLVYVKEEGKESKVEMPAGSFCIPNARISESGDDESIGSELRRKWELQ
jgi:hypothetical protein